jgi:hypothetical protein
MEGYYWRFWNAAAGCSVIALCGVCRASDGVWAVVALAGHPGGFVRWEVAPRARADPDGFGVQAWGAADGESPLLTGGPDRQTVRRGPDARLEASFAAGEQWPRRAFGALGVAQAAPGLPQYWQPMLLGAEVSGSARLGDEELSGLGEVYAEKNWGAAFPAEWWWGQAGFGDGALAAFAGGRLRGPLAASAVVVRTGDGDLLRFAPPGAAVSADAGGGEWRLRGRSARHRVLVEGDGADPHILPVPVVAERRAVLRSEHHLAGRLRVRVLRGRRLVMDEESSLAALEHGTPA